MTLDQFADRRSALGQKRKSRSCGGMTASPPRADIGRAFPEVRLVPLTEVALAFWANTRANFANSQIVSGMRLQLQSIPAGINKRYLVLLLLNRCFKGGTNPFRNCLIRKSTVQ